VPVKKHFFIDDVSSDETRDIVQGYLASYKADNVEFITRETRAFKTKNVDDIIESIDDPEGVVLIVDGDDWLSTGRATSILAEKYTSNPQLEYVYSNWVYSHNMKPGISRKIPDESWDPYTGDWITSHLSSFKIKAYKRIPKSNFVDNNGEYFKMACDHACMLPLVKSIKLTYGNYDNIEFLDMPLYFYQFSENESRPRDKDEGIWEAQTAYNSARFIKQRGYLSE
jgi:hypothetical protein